MTLGDVTANIVANTKGFTAGMNEAQNSLTSMGKKVGDFGKGMSTVGSNMTRSLTLPILALGGASVKMGMNFNTSMTKLRTQIGLTEKEVESMRESVLKMSREIGRSPQDLGEGLFFVASAGFRGAEALDILRMSGQLAALGMGDTKVVANLVTSAMAAYGSEVLSASQASDILLVAVREGKLEAEELSEAMGVVLPVASNMGVQFHEVAAAMAGMSRTGTGASEAATQLNGIFSSLLKVTPQSAKALESVGLSAEGIRKQLREEGLLATLQNLTESFEGNDNAIVEVFGNIRALRGVLDLLGGNAEDNIGIFDALTDTVGATDEAFNILSDTNEFQLQQAFASSRVAAIRLSDTLDPYVTKAITELNNKIDRLIAWWAGLDKQTQKNILGFIGFVAAAGPVLWIIGKVIAIVGTAIQVLGFLKGAFAVVSVVGLGLAGAIGFVIGALAWLIYEISQVVKHWTFYKQVVITEWNIILRHLRSLAPKILEAIIAPWRQAYNNIVAIANRIRAAANAINPLTRHSPSLVDNVKKGLGLITKEYDKFGMSMNFNPVSQNMLQGGDVLNIAINLDGANITSPEIAGEYAEQIGDAIIGKLRGSRRSYA